MKSYSYLKTLSNLIAFVAYLILVVGFLSFLALFYYIYKVEFISLESYYILIPFIGSLLVSIIFFIIFMSLSQFIVLMIDIVNRVDNIDHNVMVIAEKIKEEYIKRKERTANKKQSPYLLDILDDAEGDGCASCFI